ncbi:MAG: hypothetical protein B7Z37_22710 [Verrucomicrobia bacterium 12-59-8]|nr:MAG: hypothetical protein B7Z37_22710 [Verrucomicrobia bacterium 12-59-8]
MNRIKIVLPGIGAIAILCAVFGLWYNAYTLELAFSGKLQARGEPHEEPYFELAFYVMSAVCVICYLLLIFFGIQFLRGRTVHVRAFTRLLIFEVIYFFLIAMLWLVPDPDMGMSIAAATGIANGSLMAQFVILFPLWAPPLAFWAQRHLPPDTTNPSP